MTINKKRKAPGCLAPLFVILILIGIVGGILFAFDKLQPVIDFAKDFKNRATAEYAAANSEPLDPTTRAVAPEVPEEIETIEYPEIPIDDDVPTDDEWVDETEEEPDDDAKLAAAYRSKFQTPKIGSRMKLPMRKGTTVKGRLKSLSDKIVVIKKSKALATIARSQMAPLALAMCYEDDYVTYMVKLHKKRIAEKKATDALMARLKAEYQAEAAAHKKRSREYITTRKVQHKRKRQKESFADWMQTHEDSDQLKARKARIAQYEAERMAAGREH